MRQPSPAPRPAPSGRRGRRPGRAAGGRTVGPVRGHHLVAGQPSTRSSSTRSPSAVDGRQLARPSGAKPRSTSPRRRQLLRPAAASAVSSALPGGVHVVEQPRVTPWRTPPPGAGRARRPPSRHSSSGSAGADRPRWRRRRRPTARPHRRRGRRARRGRRGRVRPTPAARSAPRGERPRPATAASDQPAAVRPCRPGAQRVAHRSDTGPAGPTSHGRRPRTPARAPGG